MIAIFAAAAAFAQPALQPWSALTGHCWRGPAPGNSGIDTHCFESIYGGQHIRDRHVVTNDGRAVYEGETLYSVHGPQVVFTYWNSLGGFGTGPAVISGSDWRFGGTIHARPPSSEQPMAAHWKVGADGYEILGEPGGPRLFKRAD